MNANEEVALQHGDRVLIGCNYLFVLQGSGAQELSDGVHVCVCVCICTCLIDCIYECVRDLCMYVCMYVCMSECMYVSFGATICLCCGGVGRRD